MDARALLALARLRSVPAGLGPQQLEANLADAGTKAEAAELVRGVVKLLVSYSGLMAGGQARPASQLQLAAAGNDGRNACAPVPACGCCLTCAAVPRVWLCSEAGGPGSAAGGH